MAESGKCSLAYYTKCDYVELGKEAVRRWRDRSPAAPAPAPATSSREVVTRVSRRFIHNNTAMEQEPAVCAPSSSRLFAKSHLLFYKWEFPYWGRTIARRSVGIVL